MYKGDYAVRVNLDTMTAVLVKIIGKGTKCYKTKDEYAPIHEGLCKKFLYFYLSCHTREDSNNTNEVLYSIQDFQDTFTTTFDTRKIIQLEPDSWHTTNKDIEQSNQKIWIDDIINNPCIKYRNKIREAIETWTGAKMYKDNLISACYERVIPNIQPNKENNMSNVRIVTVQLMDNTKGILEASDRVVAVYKNIATVDDDQTTIHEVIMNKDVKKAIKAHNEKRSNMLNVDIQERTGQSVMLQPIKLRDLTWIVKDC